MTGMSARRSGLAGLTLVEVLVALVVFAVIGGTAFSMLDQTLRSDRLVGARLDRLADLRRAMQVLRLDTLQAEPNTLKAGQSGISFLRSGTMSDQHGLAASGLLVTYDFHDEWLIREIGTPGGEPARQTLLNGVGGVTWRFHAAGTDWLPDVPPDGADGIELVVHLNEGQDMRGVFALPQDLRTAVKQ